MFVTAVVVFRVLRVEGVKTPQPRISAKFGVRVRAQMIAFALVGLALSPRVHRHAAADALDAEADEQMSLTDFEHKFKVERLLLENSLD